MAVTSGNNSVKMTANADLFPAAAAAPRPSYTVKAITWSAPAATTYIKLLAGSSSGPVLWEKVWAAGLAAATSSNDLVTFTTGYGVYLSTDATVSVNLQLGCDD